MNMKNVLELDELELCKWIYINSIDIDRNYGEHLMYLPYHCTTMYSQINSIKYQTSFEKLMYFSNNSE